jgi:hypothetical protein
LEVNNALQKANEMIVNFISPVFSIPPEKRIKLLTQIKESPVELLEGLFSIVFPKPMIDRGIRLHLFANNSKQMSAAVFPDIKIAESDELDEMLRNCFVSKEHEFMNIKLNYLPQSVLYNDIYSSKCSAEINCEPLDERARLTEEELKYNVHQSQSQPKPIPQEEIKEPVDGNEKEWKSLSKSLCVDKEALHRLQREVDEKKNSLRLAGTEIIDLRRTVNMLQSENSTLKKKLGEEDQFQVQKMISYEISKMSVEELKSKVVKIANAYRNEKMRNEELERALQASKIEINGAYKIKEKYDQLIESHEAKCKKLHDLQRESQKLSIYKETIQKQEKVISKLEALLAKAAEAVRDKKEIESKDKKSQIDMAKIKAEISKEISTAIKQIGTSAPATDIHYDWEDEKAQLENDLFQAESKIKSLEMELTKSAEDHGREISRLRIELNDKNAQLESLSINDQNVELN